MCIRDSLESAFQPRCIEGLFRTHVQCPAFRLGRTEHGDLLVGEQGWRMTFRTARDKGAEYVHAFNFALAQRLVITERVAIIATVQRDQRGLEGSERAIDLIQRCLLYTSDAADERSSVDLGGRRIIKKKKHMRHHYREMK